MCIRGIPPSHRLILVVVQHTTLYKKTYNDMYALKRKTETEIRKTDGKEQLQYKCQQQSKNL